MTSRYVLKPDTQNSNLKGSHFIVWAAYSRRAETLAAAAGGKISFHYEARL